MCVALRQGSKWEGWILIASPTVSEAAPWYTGESSGMSFVQNRCMKVLFDGVKPNPRLMKGTTEKADKD